MLRALAIVLLFSTLRATAAPAPDWEHFETLRNTPDEALEWLSSLGGAKLGPSDRLRVFREENGLLVRLGRHAQAASRCEEWLADARKHDNARELAEALLDCGRASLVLDRFDDALAPLEEARAVARSESLPGLEFAALLALSDTALKRGEYDLASARLDEAERLWRLDGEATDGARLWTARAGIAFRQFRKADTVLYRLRAVQQARKGGDDALLFQALTNLARAHLDLQDYAAAIPLFIETANLEARPLDRVVNLLQLGISQFELNRFDAARATFERAREAAARLDSPRLEATSLGELGLTAWQSERNAKLAVRYYEQAIERLSAIGDRVNVSIWRSNMAVVLRETGRYEEALHLYRRVERDLSEIEGQQVWPAVYKGMGESQIALGQHEEAGDTLARCLQAARVTGDAKRIWECEHLRGRLHASEGEFNEARDAFERALGEIERVRVSLLVGRFKADFFEDKLEVFQEFAALLASHLPGEHGARESFEVSERARARAFLDEWAHEGGPARHTVSEDLLNREDSLLRELWALQQRAGPTASHERERLEAELDQVLLAARRQSDRPTDPSGPAGLDEIQRALQGNERILAYWLSEPRSHLWRISPSRIERFDLPSAAEIERLVRNVYGQLLDPSVAPDFSALSSALLGPLRSHDPAAEFALIVPSGILHYFPFEVLSLGDGVLLGERVKTAYLPSASAMVLLRGLEARPGRPRLLAVGDVESPGWPGKGDTGGEWPAGPLPYAAEELRAVTGRFGRSATTRLTGDDATENRVKAMPLDEFSVLHFATHGWIDPASQTASGLLLAATERGEDGLLQPRDIQRLGLDAELVVLSACESGLGKLVTGEGMVGLTRAFLQAGSRSVVASLWSVNDRASALFMDVFYKELRRGAGRADALAAARRSLRADPTTAHPYYWAPWVLTGEGRDGVPMPARRHRWPLAVIVVLALAGLGLHWRSQRVS